MSGFDGGHCGECGGTDGMHYSDCSYDGTGSRGYYRSSSGQWVYFVLSIIFGIVFLPLGFVFFILFISS